MGLFDMFKKKACEAAGCAKGARDSVAVVDGGPDRLCAPVSGRLITMSEVPDPVFAGEMLGKGCAIWPNEDCVYAPISGKVTVAMGHAIALRSSEGVEVLVHCGIDTVNLGGKGFVGYVGQGDLVKAGQPILSVDRAAVADAGYKDCVVMAISNTVDFADVALACGVGESVRAGERVVDITRL